MIKKHVIICVFILESNNVIQNLHIGFWVTPNVCGHSFTWCTVQLLIFSQKNTPLSEKQGAHFDEIKALKNIISAVRVISGEYNEPKTNFVIMFFVRGGYHA